MKKIYHSFWQISLMFGLTLVTSGAQALECTPTPDCGSLGYTKTEADCQGADVVLKCPTDTSKISCWTQLEERVMVGAILYGDGTVSSDLISGKSPIGVVFDATHRLAVALTDVKQDGSAGSEKMPWGIYVEVVLCDIPNLENCENENEALTTCGADGRANTDAILASTCSSETIYAANAVNAYQTSNCSADFCQKGKWFLPSFRELSTIYDTREVINNSLTALSTQGARKMDEYDLYLSSTVFNPVSAWGIKFLYGTHWLISRYQIIDEGYVRPVIAF